MRPCLNLENILVHKSNGEEFLNDSYFASGYEGFPWHWGDTRKAMALNNGGRVS